MTTSDCPTMDRGAAFGGAAEGVLPEGSGQARVVPLLGMRA